MAPAGHQDQTQRRKSDPYRSAMSMLTFFINRPGASLSPARRRRLARAKDKLLRFLCTVLLGCSIGVSMAQGQSSDSAGTAVSKAQSAAQAWLQVVDAGRYDQSWDSAAAVFRSAVTKAQWSGAVREGRAPFEPLGRRTLIAATYTTQLPNVPPGQYVVIQYRTKAGQGRTVVETITPARDPDGRWRVAGYYIRPE